MRGTATKQLSLLLTAMLLAPPGYPSSASSPARRPSSHAPSALALPLFASHRSWPSLVPKRSSLQRQALILKNELQSGVGLLIVMQIPPMLYGFFTRAWAPSIQDPALLMAAMWVPTTISFMIWYVVQNRKVPKKQRDLQRFYVTPALFGALSEFALYQSFLHLPAVTGNAARQLATPTVLFLSGLILFREREFWKARGMVFLMCFSGALIYLMPALFTGSHHVIGIGMAWALASGIFNGFFTVSQLYFSSYRLKRFSVIRLTLFTHTANALYSLLWLGLKHGAVPESIHSAILRAPIWFWIAVMAYGLFNSFIRTLKTTAVMHKEDLTRVGGSFLVSQPMHVFVNAFIRAEEGLLRGFISSLLTIGPLVWLMNRIDKPNLEQLRHERELLDASTWAEAITIIGPSGPYLHDPSNAFRARQLGRSLARERFRIRTRASKGLLERVRRAYRAHTAHLDDPTMWVQNVYMAPTDGDPSAEREHAMLAHRAITRKQRLLRNTRGVIAFPGDLEALDEVMEAVRLKIPVVLLGSENQWEDFLNALPHATRAAVSKRVLITNRVPDAVHYIQKHPVIASASTTSVSSADAMKDLSLGLRRINDWFRTFDHQKKPVVVIGGETGPSRPMRRTLESFAHALFGQGRPPHPIRLATRSRLLWNVLHAKAEEWKNTTLLQAVVLTSAKNRASNIDEHAGENNRLIQSVDWSVHQILSTKHALGFIIYPNGITTLAHFLDILAAMRLTSAPERPVLLLGRSEWQPLADYLTPLLSDDERARLHVVDDPVEIMEALGLLTAATQKSPSPLITFLRSVARLRLSAPVTALDSERRRSAQA